MIKVASTLLAAIAFTFLSAQAIAAEIIDPLRSVSKATVAVSYSNTGTAPLGISEQRIRTLLELKLRSIGLRVLTEKEDREDRDLNPYVNLEVSSLETSNRGGAVTGFAYRVHLSLRIIGQVSLNKALAPLELWSDNSLRVASRDDAPAQIERMINELSDSLLNAWLKANPKR